MTKQTRHWRTSKKGKKFRAGRRRILFNEAPYVIVYHGTHPNNTARILKEGIKPSTETGRRTWEKTQYKNKVYLTPSLYLARAYGGFDVYGKTDIIKVRISRSQLLEGYKLSDPMIGKEEIVLDKILPSQIVGVIRNTNAAVMREILRQNRQNIEFHRRIEERDKK